MTLEGLPLRFAGRGHGAEFYHLARFGLTAAALYLGGLLSTDEAVSFRAAAEQTQTFAHRLGGLSPGEVVLLVTRQGDVVHSDMRPVGVDGYAEPWPPGCVSWRTRWRRAGRQRTGNSPPC